MKHWRVSRSIHNFSVVQGYSNEKRPRLSWSDFMVLALAAFYPLFSPIWCDRSFRWIRWRGFEQRCTCSCCLTEWDLSNTAVGMKNYTRCGVDCLKFHALAILRVYFNGKPVVELMSWGSYQVPSTNKVFFNRRYSLRTHKSNHVGQQVSKVQFWLFFIKIFIKN